MSNISSFRVLSLFKRKIHPLPPSGLQVPFSNAAGIAQGASRCAPPHSRSCQASSHEAFPTSFYNKKYFPSGTGIPKRSGTSSSIRAASFRHQTMIVTPTTIIGEFLNLFPPRDVHRDDGSGPVKMPEMRDTPKNAFPNNTDTMRSLAARRFGLHDPLISRRGSEDHFSHNVEEGSNPTFLSLLFRRKSFKAGETKPGEGTTSLGSVTLSSQSCSEVSFDWDRLFLIRVAAVDTVVRGAPTSPQVSVQLKPPFPSPTRGMLDGGRDGFHAKVEPSAPDTVSGRRSCGLGKGMSDRPRRSPCVSDLHGVGYDRKESLWLRMIETLLCKRRSSETQYAQPGEPDPYVKAKSCSWRTPAVYYMYYHEGGALNYRAVGRLYAIPGLPQPPTNFNSEWPISDPAGAASIHPIIRNRPSSASTNPYSSFHNSRMSGRDLDAARGGRKDCGGGVGQNSEKHATEDDVGDGTASPSRFAAFPASSEIQQRIRVTATVMTLNEYIAFICPSYRNERHEKRNVALDEFEKGSSFTLTASTFLSQLGELENEPLNTSGVPASHMRRMGATNEAPSLGAEQPGENTTESTSEGAKPEQNTISKDSSPGETNLRPSHSHFYPEPHVSKFFFSGPQSYAEQSTSRGSTSWCLHPRGGDVHGGVMNWSCVPFDVQLSKIHPFLGRDGAVGRGESGDRDSPARVAWEGGGKQLWTAERAVGVLLLLAEECIYYEMLLHVHNPLLRSPARREGDLAASRELSFPQPPLLCTRGEDSAPRPAHRTFARVVHRMELPFFDPSMGRGGGIAAEKGRDRVDRRGGPTVGPHPAPPNTVLVYEAWNAYAVNTPLLRFSDGGTGNLRTESRGGRCPASRAACGATASRNQASAIEAGFALHRRLLSVHLDPGKASGGVQADDGMPRDHSFPTSTTNTPRDEANVLINNEQREKLKLTCCKLDSVLHTINNFSTTPFVAFSPFPPSKYLLKNQSWYAKPFVLAEEMRYGLLIKY